jgi:putative NADH-flavin reductase
MIDMRIALIGATGFVGSHLLTELTSRGHNVTAIARHASNLPAEQNVQAVEINVNDVDNLAQVLQGHDLVINAFNPGWSDPTIYDDFLRGARNIQAATEKSGVTRFITIGGAGSLYINGQQLVDSSDFPEAYKPGAQAARDYLDEIKKETELDWVFVSPAIEMSEANPGSRIGKYRLGKDEPVLDSNGRSILSVEDLAVVIADEAEKPTHHRERFTAAY